MAYLRAPGRLLALGLLALLVLARILDPVPVQDLRHRAFDLAQRLMPRSYEEAPVRIVEIDEASLARFGQWPWPRTLVAELVDRIADAEPAVLGLDVIFAEPDRLSPDQLATVPGLPAAVASQLAALPPSEIALAAALRRVPTVSGVGPLNEAQPYDGPLRATPVAVEGEDPAAALFSYKGLLRSLPALTAAERGRGALSGDADPDGVVRRVPLVMLAEERMVPLLSVELLRVAQQLPLLTVLADRHGVTGVRVGDMVLPTDRRGRAWPWFTPPLAHRYISAAALLDGTADRAALQGAIVILGVTGLGLVDVKQTPVGPMQGAEVHAQVIESALLGTLLLRPGALQTWEFALVLVSGLIVVLALPFGRPLAAVLAQLALVTVLAGAGFAAWRSGLLVDTVSPVWTSSLLFAVMLGAALRAAEAARRRLALALQKEREAKARLEGELGAARAIQMGLLPRRFPAFPHRTDIDLHALIEPARTVGGDLYDFVLLDGDHLFFSIGDVSGKGIPAALFMAMTREVLHSAALRLRLALGDILTEANAKISAAGTDMLAEGADMMFVTLFAGVLNLRTGVLVYAGAGHDAPFLLDGRGAPRQLLPAGGPPLGCVDDFVSPLEQTQLAPGETLVLFTDGVTEAQNAAHELYSPARLEAVLAAQRSLEAKALNAAIRADLHGFVAEAEQYDDITLLAVRWTGPSAAPGVA
jgi:serine phosphatase RsbU (regulator of sigma subunit)/CHASE2 domain-containing sensor protein